MKNNKNILTYIIIPLLLFILLSPANAASPVWEKELSNFEFLTAFIDGNNNIHILGYNKNETTSFLYTYSSNGTLLREKSISNEVVATRMEVFTSLNNGSIVSYTMLNYYEIPYSNPINLSYYNNELTLTHQFVIDPAEISEGFEILWLRIAPTGDIYLMLSKNIRENPNSDIRFVRMAPNGSIIWNTLFSPSLFKRFLQEQKGDINYQQNSAIFASISNGSV